jgi:hypothetical protein
MTPDQIQRHPFFGSASFVPLGHASALCITARDGRDERSIEIDSRNFCLVFLFLTNRLDTPLKIDTSIYYSEHFYDFILESLFSTILGE